jgi:putative lipoic acid-binding regulatory protein
MSLKVPDSFSRTPPVQKRELAFPAVFHFRIIVEASVVAAQDALRAVLADYTVVAPLAASKASSAGRYQAYCVSVELQSPSEHLAFDAAVKGVSGVRMLL